MVLRRRAARQNLGDFCREIYPPYQSPPHLLALHEKLERVERGECSRLMVTMPPRHGKSQTVSRLFPSWYMGRNPDKRIISTSYSGGLAGTFSRDVRNTLLDPTFHTALFPGITLAHDSKGVMSWDVASPHLGGMRTSGVGGGITGHGAHLFIIDDPVRNRQDADSERLRSSVWDWYTDTARTRLEPGGAIVLCMTRWHFDDLGGRLLRNMDAEDTEQWETIDFPAVATGPDELGREEGEALWPERYDVDALRGLRATVGARTWAALYQQQPTVNEGQIFPSDRWQVYDPNTIQWLNPYTIQLWDTAFKDSSGADYSACATWSRDINGNCYLRDFWKGRPEFPELKRRMALQWDKWRPVQVVIEDKASGQSAIQELKRAGNVPVVGYNPDTDKVSRAHSVTPYIEAGRVYIPNSAEWLHDWLDEHEMFPMGAHDDAVDTTTMALTKLLREHGGAGIEIGTQEPAFASAIGESLWT